MTLKAIQFLSVRVPSGQIVTMHSGNTRDIADADARWMLDAYPQRVVALDAPDDQLVANAEDVPADNASDVDEVDAKPKPRKSKKG